MKLKLIPRFDDVDLPAYRHPNGWRIMKQRRTWSERGRQHGLPAADTPPLYWYEVWNARQSLRRQPHPAQEFVKLAEARAWCDAHKPVVTMDGWKIIELDELPS